jgi:ABC-type polysaccharide/polyol phosphate transport system ATPase subunit
MTVIRYSEHQPGQPVLELRHVARRFIKRRERNRSFQDKFIRLLSRRNVQQEDFWPLRDVSIRLERGQSLGVIGPNGAGKSTLLKLVTGILTPTSGDLLVNGRLCSLLELGAGFQPDLTGRENIFLNGSIYGLNRREMNTRLESIIDFAELGDFIDTPVRHYSSGMYVRLGFAVAIHTDPDLLLVDEVLAVGDQSFQHKCLSAIQRFREGGGTLLLVSHDLEAVQAICRQAIWLEHGLVQSEGQPTDVVMRYLREQARREEERAASRQAENAGQRIDAPGRWGSGKVRITHVELCNGSGETTTTFASGEPLTVRLHYTATRRVEKPVFGLAVYHESGAHVTGPNTQFGGLDIPAVEGTGMISYQASRLPLLAGRYRLSVAVVDGVDNETYDYHDRLYDFQIYPDKCNERYGIVTLGGGWRLETPVKSHERTMGGGDGGPVV